MSARATLLTRSVWLRRMLTMTGKELLQFVRDPVLLFFVLYAFTFDIYNAGSGVTLALTRGAVAVHDLDRSAASRELLSRLLPPQFNVIGETGDARSGDELLNDGSILMLVSVPPQFDADLQAGRPAAVQMEIDASNTVLSTFAYSYATQIVGQFGLESGLRRIGLGSGGLTEAPLVDNRIRSWFNPNQNDAWFMSISEMLNVITAFSILLTAALMVREKERGTIEQLLVSPLTPFQIMAPKVIAMTLIIHCGIVIAFSVVMQPVFDVPFRGDLLLFFAVTTLYIITLAALGLMIATMTRNLAQAAMLSILFLTPMMFLSGLWTPPEAMTPALRLLMYISPLHYYMDAVYGILLKGANLHDIRDSVAGIIVLGVLIGGSNLSRFRKQFD